MDKFLDEFIFPSELSDDEVSDGVWCYSVSILKCFMVIADFKDAVSTGNGDHISILRKQLLVHFFSIPGFNQFAIEMLINILQCEVLLSEAWAATVKEQVKLTIRSSSHTHKSSEDDEKIICRDLRGLRPFKHQDGRSFETFVGISPDPTYLLDTKLFKEWLDHHKNNILMHYPVTKDVELDNALSDSDSE